MVDVTSIAEDFNNPKGMRYSHPSPSLIYDAWLRARSYLLSFLNALKVFFLGPSPTCCFQLFIPFFPFLLYCAYWHHICLKSNDGCSRSNLPLVQCREHNQVGMCGHSVHPMGVCPLGTSCDISMRGREMSLLGTGSL